MFISYFDIFVFLGVAHRVTHRVAHGLAHGPRPRFCPHPLVSVIYRQTYSLSNTGGVPPIMADTGWLLPKGVRFRASGILWVGVSLVGE